MSKLSYVFTLTRKTPEVWPLVTFVSAGLAFMVYKGVQHAGNPDVQFDRSRRNLPAWDPRKYDEDTGRKWHDRIATMYRPTEHADTAATVFDAFTPGWLSTRWRTLTAPLEADTRFASTIAQKYNTRPVGIAELQAGSGSAVRSSAKPDGAS